MPVVAPLSEPRIIPRSDHIVSRSHISPNALRVLYRLRDAGFQGFLVGGCVRDLLIGIEPKDFDVATDALPEQIKKLFRNCRLVGRRFRLAHVFFGRETIEVATFRAATAPSQAEEPVTDVDEALEGSADADLADTRELPEAEDDDEDTAELPQLNESRRGAFDSTPDTERLFDESGRILRDNVYGTIGEDVWRRDFTCNSLYYNISDFSIWDYCDGARDIEHRTLRMIGDPTTRYREDPVRMLRAARFEAKLGFGIAPESAEPIEELRTLLAGVPPARLFDETLKLFLTGHGEQSLAVLRRRGLLAVLLPETDAYLQRHPGSVVEKLLIAGLRNTDDRVRKDKPVAPTFLFALLLYGPIATAIEASPPEHWHELGTILDACDRAARQVQAHIALPRRFSLGVREMFAMQPRLEHPRGKRALRTLEHPRFRAAFDLLVLRAELGLASSETAEWWTQLQEASAEERDEMVESATSSAGGPPKSGGARRGGRHRRRRRRPANPV